MELRELNVEAEKLKTYGKAYPKEFQKRYATCIVEMEKINVSLDKVMQVIQVYLEEVTKKKYVFNLEKGNFKYFLNDMLFFKIRLLRIQVMVVVQRSHQLVKWFILIR